MKKTFHGSCHCGAVRFACDVDLAAGTTRCNCSFCRESRMWFAIVPDADLRMLAGDDALSDYQHTRSKTSESFLHFTFCGHCGVRPFTRGGHLPSIGSSFYAVNVACLDDVTDDELASAPIHYPDGRNDDWSSEAPHPYL